MKKTVLFILLIVMISFSICIPAFATEGIGKISVIIVDAQQEQIGEFHFFNTADFIGMVTRTKKSWESEGYECSTENSIRHRKISFFKEEMSAVLHCKKK